MGGGEGQVDWEIILRLRQVSYDCYAPTFGKNGRDGRHTTMVYNNGVRVRPGS
jgi:hypothetical protein